ncbi:phospholipase A2-like isoform X2 [Atheta coriaria]|uniref:phospholipase A2-like isoform X2 n=1 Tax=Dalotia coriaria TaxID=877792 RepID=UPI0031F4568A
MKLFIFVFVVFCAVCTQAQQTLKELVIPGSSDHGGLTKHCFAEPNTISDSDLGAFKDTDTCCMMHNKCPRLGPNKLYDCECEETFRKCLRANKPSPGESLFRTKYGKNYFNVVYPKCTKQGGSFTCASKITSNTNGDQRCGTFNITPGTEYLSLDNKFYETV